MPARKVMQSLIAAPEKRIAQGGQSRKKYRCSKGRSSTKDHLGKKKKKKKRVGKKKRGWMRSVCRNKRWKTKFQKGPMHIAMAA